MRFALTLVSLTVLVMSFVSLTSLSEGYGLMVVRSTTLTPHEGVLLRASTWTLAEPTFMEFVDSEVEWILGHGEVEGVSVKIENVPQQSPLTSLSGNRIYSIIGVNVANESRVVPLDSALSSGTLPGPGEVALSVSLATKLGLKLGDTVRLRDRVLTLSGLARRRRLLRVDRPRRHHLHTRQVGEPEPAGRPRLLGEAGDARV